MELNLLTLEETATLRNLLSHATHIVICAHKSPDGDAIGSSLAWMHYLKQTGKTDVRVCMPDATPDFLHWLPGHNSVIRYDRHPREVEKAFREADLVCCLDFNQNSRVDAMQEVLDKYPQLDGVFCDNADIADLYLDMKKDETKDSIVMVGVDATAKQQEAIRNGKEVGVVSQQPYAMGYQTIWTALLTTAPKKSVEIKRNVRIDPAWIDSSNIDDPTYSSYLYAN